MKYLAFTYLFLFCVNFAYGQVETRITTGEISQLTYNVCVKSLEKPDKMLFEKFEQAIAAQPKNYKLYLERAKCSKIINDYPSALKDVSTILNILPSFRGFHSSFLMDLDDLVWTADLDEASERADYLMTNNAGHFYSFLQNSSVKIRRNDFQGAFESYLKSAELEPLFSTYRLGILGDSLNKLKSEKNNIEYFNRAFSLYEKIQLDFNSKIQLNKGDTTALFQMKGTNLQIGNLLQAWSLILADLYLEKGETDKSNAVLERMIKIYPAWMAYQFRSGYYNRKGNSQRAEEDRIKSIEAKIESVTKEIEDVNIIKPRKASALITRGDYFLDLKQFDKAIADYEMAKNLDSSLTAKADLKIDSAKSKAVEKSQPK